MAVITAQHRMRTKLAILDHWKVRWLLSPGSAEAMATELIDYTQTTYESGLIGEPLRDKVRDRMTERYGSITTIILFAIIWTLIKQLLLEIA